MATDKLFRSTDEDEHPERSGHMEASEPPWLKAVDLISVSLAVIGGIACAVLAINVIADVIGRSVFSKPLGGTLDLTTYGWMPTLISLGLGYALLRGEHIRVSLLTASAPPRVQRILEIASMVIIVVIAATLAYYSMQKAVSAGSYGESAVGTPWLTIWPFRWVVVVGLVGLALQGLAQLVRAIQMKDFNPDAFDEELEAL